MAVDAAAARSSAFARAVPVWAWLGALVALSAVVRYALARRVPAPWIMVDELIYAELAKSFGESGRFLLRGVPSPGYGFVYPILISPAFALFESVPRAYEAAKAINALVMSLAAIPAYFLARRVLSSGLAILAAALTLAVPSMVYTGNLMTENAFYPLFLCVALALVLALEHPTPARQLGLLALVGLAYLTRAQALAFVPAVAVAPLALRRAREFRVLYGALAAAVGGVLVLQLARGRSPLDALGAYAVAGEHRYDPAEVARWLLYHVAELDLYLGVAPFVALVVLSCLVGRLARTHRAFVVALASLSVFFVLEVAAFASLPSVQRIEERNLFYLAPLALIALLLWCELDLPRPMAIAGGAAAVAAALPGAIPYERLIGVPSQSDTLALLPLWRLNERGWVGLDELAALVVVGAVAMALACLLVPRRFALALPLLVLAYFLAAQRPIEARLHHAAIGARAEGIMNPQRDWVERAARGREVAVLWTGNTSRYTVWENEFFSPSIGPVYDVGDAILGGLPSTRVTIEPRSGLVRADGRPIRPPLVLTDGSITPAGDVVASDPKRGVFLFEVARPLRTLTSVAGLYANDTWSGPTVTYTRRSCEGGTLTVVLHSDPNLFQKPQRIVARSGGVVRRARLRPRAEAYELTVPLRPRASRCVVRFDVSPTAVPGHGDLRRLGVHFSAFRYKP